MGNSKGMLSMIHINIVFDDLLDDADIIAVPDEIAPRIQEVGQEFLRWVPSAQDSMYWTEMDGRKCAIAETDGFIKWLNENYCKGLEKACVVARNTNYHPNLKTVEF